MITTRELRSQVVAAVEGHGLEPLRVELTVELCRWALADVPELGVPHLGRTVRTALQLMLAEAVPELTPEVRNDLARACEVIAVRGR